MSKGKNMAKINLSSFKQYGRQEMELNRLLKAVKNSKNLKEEMKAKTSLRKYLKKTNLSLQIFYNCQIRLGYIQMINL